MAHKIAILVTAVILAVTTLNCQSKQERSTPEETAQRAPDQESWNSTIILTTKGHKRAVIHAGHIAKYLHSRITHMDQGLEVQFYDQEGRPGSVLTAQKGIVDQRAQNLEAMGDVVVLSPKGTKLEAESLRWDPQKGKIFSDGFVRLSIGKGVVTGTGFEADQSLEHWSIKRNIKGVFEETPKGQ